MTSTAPQLESGELGADCYRIPIELFERINTERSGVVGVCRLGPLSAPRLFYIHGFNNFTRVNSPLLLRLAESFRVLTCDLPGNGWTDPPKDGNYTPGAFLTCVYEVLCHEGWASTGAPRPGKLPPRGYHLCGHSQGGMLCILAAEDPRFHDDILSVTPICPAGISMPYLKEARSRTPRLFLSFIRFLCWLLPQALLARIVRRNIYPGFDELPSELRKFFIETFDSYLRGDIAPAGPSNAPVLGGPPGKFLYRALYMLQYFPWEDCQRVYELFCRDPDLAGKKRVILSGRDTTCPAEDVLKVIRGCCTNECANDSSLAPGPGQQPVADALEGSGPARHAEKEYFKCCGLQVIYYAEDNHEVPVYNADKVSADVKRGRVRRHRYKQISDSGSPADQQLDSPATVSDVPDVPDVAVVPNAADSSDYTTSSSESELEYQFSQPGVGNSGASEAVQGQGDSLPDFSDIETDM